MHKISKSLHDHYRNKFLEYGATSMGVDWGIKEWAAELRQIKMLEVISNARDKKVSLLDVGCGYGALADTIKEIGLNVDYFGVDVVPEIVAEARKRHPDYKFYTGDFLELSLEQYDYVVCNGIMTQKLTATTLEMNNYCKCLIKMLFDKATHGIAFNLMNTHVNFQKDSLYYRNPVELMAWCISELSPHIKVDCAYELFYEYTIFLYKYVEPHASPL